jgi:hypothetical protein
MDLSSQRQYIQRAETAHEILTTTDLTTLYTSPSGGDYDFSIVQSILVCDHDNNATDITVTVTHDATVYNLFKEFTIGAYSTEELLSKSIIIHQGDILKVQANRAGNLTVYASIVEYGKGD